MMNSRHKYTRSTKADVVRQRLSRRIDELLEQTQIQERLSNNISLARLLVFLAAACLLVYGFWNTTTLWAVLAGGGLAIVFFTLVIRHDQIIGRLEKLKLLCEVNLDNRHRLERNWGELAQPQDDPRLLEHPLANDLDLYNVDQQAASLSKLLSAVKTPLGRKTLANWLLEPATASQISARQEAVKVLTDKWAWRQDFECWGRKVNQKHHDPKSFFSLLEDNDLWQKKPWLGWVVGSLTAITLILLIGNFLGLLAPWWLWAVAVNLVFSFVFQKGPHETFSKLEWGQHTLGHYAGMLNHLAALEKEDKLDSWLEHAQQAAGQLRRLDRIMGLVEVRHSTFGRLIAQGLFLWEFHWLKVLHNWREKNFSYVRSWFAALAEIEVLSAFGGLAQDHPDWQTAEFSSLEERRIVARGLGHPLLPPESCVVNDLELGSQESFLLVTGSNMSGKSTLLRALGLNVILAQAGAPVCAEKMAIPPLAIGSHFRVRDAIGQGVSFFMAELERIRQVVAEAHQTCRQGRRVFLFLLDEILLGTNVFERKIAVVSVIRKLIDDQAIGAISTHDLSLAEEEEIAANCTAVHFREQFETVPEDDQPKMTFDYRLRPGIAPTTNALKLLEMMGLGG
jgi:hypothetical protein